MMLTLSHRLSRRTVLRMTGTAVVAVAALAVLPQAAQRALATEAPPAERDRVTGVLEAHERLFRLEDGTARDAWHLHVIVARFADGAAAVDGADLIAERLMPELRPARHDGSAPGVLPAIPRRSLRPLLDTVDAAAGWFSPVDDAEESPIGSAGIIHASWAEYVSLVFLTLPDQPNDPDATTTFLVDLVRWMADHEDGEHIPPCGKPEDGGERKDGIWNRLPTATDLDQLSDQPWEWISEGSAAMVMGRLPLANQSADLLAGPMEPMRCLPPEDEG